MSRLIDADALTEIIHGMYAEGDDPSTYHVDVEGDTLIGKFAVVDAIFNMPTIQPEPHWIPVEQALPEKEGKYLCTRTATWCVDGKATKVTDVAVLDYSDNIYDIWKDDGEIFQNGFAFGELWQGKLDNVQKVSAWMPMPGPYKPTVPPECEGDCGWCKPSVIEKCKGVTE